MEAGTGESAQSAGLLKDTDAKKGCGGGGEDLFNTHVA